MKLWISKRSDVPIQEQLVTQVILGIVSADLASGERLPSSTQLARQFHIHANTVRAAYRELVQRGWVEWRSGSGFYVRSLQGSEELDPALDLDHLIATFFAAARRRGHMLRDIQSRIARWLSLQTPDHIVVIEPEAELREILIKEIQCETNMRVIGVELDALTAADTLGGFCVALYDHAKEVRKRLPPEVSCLFLNSRSIPKSLASQLRPTPDILITVISGWPDFLQWARTTLVAVGIESAALDLRDARVAGWQRGLNGRSFVIADSLTATRLPAECHPHVFKIIADASIAELCQHTGKLMS